jgi:hypothetical protein
MKFISSLMYENGEVSAVRCFAVYLIIMAMHAYYEAMYSGKTFSPEQWVILQDTIRGGGAGGVGALLVNKAYNSIFNTPRNEYMRKSLIGVSEQASKTGANGQQLKL